MAYLLFECLSEEIPAKMQFFAKNRIEQLIESLFAKENIKYNDCKIYTSPRRLTILVKDLSLLTKKRMIEIRGPRVGASEMAITGFLKKVKKNQEDLKIKNTEKGDFYSVINDESSKPLSLTIQEVLEELLARFKWPKSMRLSNHSVRWIRPIINLLCLLDDNTIPIEFAGIKATNFTYGHRFRSSDKLIISNIADYLEKLKNHYVILDQDERLELIKKDALKIAKNNGLIINFDEWLLINISNLVEYPTVLLGKIDTRFMSLPQILLITVMKNHQKYHHLLTQNGDLAPFFIMVSNNGKDDVVIKGNEKVLRTRFADAEFLVQQDRYHNLEYYADKLSQVTFHSGLGSIKDKVNRVTVLSKYISVWVPNASLILIEESAQLIKADLTTAVVKEFPELQGVIGKHYAESNGANNDVAEAIEEHYHPLKSDSVCSTKPIAITLSIADKIDSIVGILAIGEKPSGSRDPFSIRRLAIGVIRTILENDIMLPMNLVIEKATNLYPTTLFKKKQILKIKQQDQNDKLQQNIVVQNVISFFKNRLKFISKAEHIDERTLNAIICTKTNFVIQRIYEEAKYLQQSLNTSQGKLLLHTYKRVNNVLIIAEKEKKAQIRKNFHRSLFIDKEEIQISTHLLETKHALKHCVNEHKIQSSLELLEMLAVSTNHFIDNVLIQHHNTDVKNNRLKILSYIRHLFNTSVSFDTLVF